MNITAPLLWLGVFVAGGVGAWCRFRLDGLIARHWSRSVPVSYTHLDVLPSVHSPRRTTPGRFMAGTSKMST